MKKINFEGEDWWYEVKTEVGEYGDYTWTYFYRKPTKTVKKWIFWGELVEKENDDYEFVVNFNIEDPHISKEKLKAYLTPYMNINKRKLEIEKGEII